MAILVKAPLGSYSRFHLLEKVWEEENLVDSHPVFDGYVYAPPVELCWPLVGQGAWETQYRNADRFVFRFERARCDPGHRGRRMGANDA